MENCVICDIVAKKEKGAIIFEDDENIIFLDKRPLFHGHCLVSPKIHFTTLYDLPEGNIQNYYRLIQRLGHSIQIAMQAQGTFIATNNTVSQSIRHLHTHVVPRNPKDGLKGFFWPRTSYQNDAEMEKVKVKIYNQLTTNNLL